MKSCLLTLLIICGFVAIWLLLWDFIDFLTTGFNEGLWNFEILANGAPSIFVGFILIVIISVLGIHVIK